MAEPANCTRNGNAVPDLKTGTVACRSDEQCRLKAGTKEGGFRCMAPLMEALRTAQLTSAAQTTRRK